MEKIAPEMLRDLRDHLWPRYRREAEAWEKALRGPRAGHGPPAYFPIPAWSQSLRDSVHQYILRHHLDLVYREPVDSSDRQRSSAARTTNREDHGRPCIWVLIQIDQALEWWLNHPEFARREPLAWNITGAYSAG
jgi:hypothetical protein